MTRPVEKVSDIVEDLNLTLGYLQRTDQTEAAKTVSYAAVLLSVRANMIEDLNDEIKRLRAEIRKLKGEG